MTRTTLSPWRRRILMQISFPQEAWSITQSKLKSVRVLIIGCVALAAVTVTMILVPCFIEVKCCVHNASTVPWTSAGQFGRPRGVRGRPWYDLWRPRCVISHPMDVRGLPPGRPPSGRPRDTQFGIDWSLLPSGCPQGVRTAEVQPITARTHYGQEVGLPTVRPKPEVDVP